MGRWVSVVLFFSVCSAMLAQCQEDTDPPEGIEPVSSEPTPNDPFFDRQYYFQKMDVLRAWKITRGSPDVSIGFVEAGFDPTHEEFQNGRVEVYQLPGMDHGPGQDWNEINHGTNTVGEVIAEADNGKGIAGLAPDCKVIVVEMGADKSNDYDLQTVNYGKAIRYLADRGCKVINCSVILHPKNKEDLEYAIDRDVVVVIASGNGNQSRPFTPSVELPALVVGGLDTNDERFVDKNQVRDGKVVSGSNYGEGLDVMAPCRDLIFCRAHDPRVDPRLLDDRWMDTNFGPARKGYIQRVNGGGTSSAAPMATALVALIRSIRPDLDLRAVIKIVEQGADDLGEEGWDEFTGYGRINFYRSLKIAQTWPSDDRADQTDTAEAKQSRPVAKRSSPRTNTNPTPFLIPLGIRYRGLER